MINWGMLGPKPCLPYGQFLLLFCPLSNFLSMIPPITLVKFGNHDGLVVPGSFFSPRLKIRLVIHSSKF